jgi:hypothetical protein
MSAPMPTAMGINRIRAAKGGSAFPTVMPCLARSAERTDCLCYEAGRGPGQYYRNTGIDTVRCTARTRGMNAKQPVRSG